MLQTPRLLLRPLSTADAAVLHELWTAPAVRRHLWDDRCLSLEQTRDLLMQSEYLFEARDLGLWGAYRSEEMIGFGGYWFFRDEHEVELLYGLAQPHWHQGFAREIAQTLIGYAFTELDFAEIRASTSAANIASVDLLKRFGFLTDPARGAGSQTLFLRLPRGVYQGPQ